MSEEYSLSFEIKNLENLERNELENICNTYKIRTEGVTTKDLIEKLKELYEFVNTTENHNEVDDILKEEDFNFQMTPIKNQDVNLEPEENSFKIEFSPKIELKKETPKKPETQNQDLKPKTESLDKRIEEIKEQRKKTTQKFYVNRIKESTTIQTEKTDKLKRKKK